MFGIMIHDEFSPFLKDSLVFLQHVQTIPNIAKELPMFTRNEDA